MFHNPFGTGKLNPGETKRLLEIKKTSSQPVSKPVEPEARIIWMDKKVGLAQLKNCANYSELCASSVFW